MAEQKVRGPGGETEPDVLTLSSTRPTAPGRADPGVAVADAPLRTRRFAQLDPDRAAYARKANRLSVRRQDGRIFAVIEVVSPCNKDGTEHFDAFARKVIE